TIGIYLAPSITKAKLSDIQLQPPAQDQDVVAACAMLLMQVSDAPALYGQLLKSLTVDGSGNNVVTYAVLDQLFKQLSDDQTANPLFTYQAVTHFLNDHVTVQLSARPTTGLTDVVLFPFAPVLGLTINGMANISPVIDAAYETAIGAYFQKMAAQFLSQTEK